MIDFLQRRAPVELSFFSHKSRGAQLPATAAYWTEGKGSAWLYAATHFWMMLQ
mgnify:CR=1 FL=1